MARPFRDAYAKYQSMTGGRAAAAVLLASAFTLWFALNLLYESRAVVEAEIVSATEATAIADDDATCDPGWKPAALRAYAAGVKKGGRPWREDWPRPLYPPGPMLKDGWAAFWAWYSALPCALHSPECAEVPRWPASLGGGCCATHLRIKGKLIAFSDHLRKIGWPHWPVAKILQNVMRNCDRSCSFPEFPCVCENRWVHSGTMLGLTREEGRLVPHDTDADINVVAKFNGRDVFKNYTRRLLAFNDGDRYAPFFLLVGAHAHQPGHGPRSPFCREPWATHRCRQGFNYHGTKEDFVATTGDFIIGPLNEFGHVDIELQRVRGTGYGNACMETFVGKHPHPTHLTESRGLPAACPFGLKVGPNRTYHGLNCPDNAIAYLTRAYGAGKSGWQSRAVKSAHTAKFYSDERRRSSNVGAAAAREAAKLRGAAASQMVVPRCVAANATTVSPAPTPSPTPPPPSARRLKKKKKGGVHWKAGFRHDMGCTCTGRGKKVKCRGGDPQRAPSSTQRKLNKLSRAEEAARGGVFTQRDR